MCNKTTKKKTGYYGDQVVKRFNCCFTKILRSGNTECCAGLLPRGEPTSINSGHKCAEETRHHPQACYYVF